MLRAMDAPTWLIVVASVSTFLTILLGVFLWSSRTQRRIRTKPPERLCTLEDGLPTVEAITGGWICGGNAIEVLQNGDRFFDRLLQDIDEARETIHIEIYVWWGGDVCDRIADALVRRADEGLEVRLLVDALGGAQMSRENREKLEASKVCFELYHDFRLRSLGRLNQRDHRKAAIFDSRVGYIFGQGFSDDWSGDARNADEWRDTGARIRGPIVARIQGAFARQWMEACAEVLTDPKYFPDLEDEGDVQMQLVASAPRGGVSPVSLLYRLMIASASSQIVIQNPYFVPDPELRQLLCQAVQRGVDVRIMVPDAVHDSTFVRNAARHTFEELLLGGVRVWFYQRTLLHQKIMLVDGVWAHIGSTNFDERSFDINCEISLGVLDEGVVAELMEAWNDDLQHSVELKLEAWRRRKFTDKLAARLAYLVNDQL